MCWPMAVHFWLRAPLSRCVTFTRVKFLRTYSHIAIGRSTYTQLLTNFTAMRLKPRFTSTQDSTVLRSTAMMVIT